MYWDRESEACSSLRGRGRRCSTKPAKNLCQQHVSEGPIHAVWLSCAWYRSSLLSMLLNTHSRATALTGNKPLHFQMSEGEQKWLSSRLLYCWSMLCRRASVRPDTNLQVSFVELHLVLCALSLILLLAQARWRSMSDCDCDCCANHSVCSLVFVFCFFTTEGALPHLLDLP